MAKTVKAKKHGKKAGGKSAMWPQVKTSMLDLTDPVERLQLLENRVDTLMIGLREIAGHCEEIITLIDSLP